MVEACISQKLLMQMPQNIACLFLLYMAQLFFKGFINYGFVTEISNFKDSRKLRQFLQIFLSFLLLMPQEIMWKGFISFSSRFFLRTQIISKVFLNHKCALRYRILKIFGNSLLILTLLILFHRSFRCIASVS